MGEPIRLWDKDGVLWVTYSPSAARLAVEAGTHTYEQPVTPNDTQEVATVKPPKRKREKGDGGVL
jgi:hypothetical protein